MRVVTYCLTSFSQPRRVTDGITCRKTANISKNFVYSIFQNLLSLIFINGSNFGFKFCSYQTLLLFSSILFIGCELYLFLLMLLEGESREKGRWSQDEDILTSGASEVQSHVKDVITNVNKGLSMYKSLFA